MNLTKKKFETFKTHALIFISLVVGFTGVHGFAEDSEEIAPRLVMFVGVDISGSFMRSKYYDDSLDFLAHYIYIHLNGYGGLEKPHSLFVGSLGGVKPNEPKTLYPIQTFEHLPVSSILTKLKSIFPKQKQKENPFTDFNAFVEQVAETVVSKKLILKPVSVVMISDGKPDLPGKNGVKGFRSIQFDPLERLSRNVTVRLLYTDAVTGKHWQNQVPRKRVKLWTQDAVVMSQWKQPNLLLPNEVLEKQTRLFDWLKDNVDFPVTFKPVE